MLSGHRDFQLLAYRKGGVKKKNYLNFSKANSNGFKDPAEDSFEKIPIYSCS